METKNEINKQRLICDQKFVNIFDKLDRLDRAVFGEQDLNRKGIFDMTTEMYNSMRMAKGGERVFWSSVKLAGGVTVLIGAFWAVVEFVRRITVS